MTRVDEFTSFYEATSATCLRAVYAMCGDRQVAQEATVDAYRRAWRDWSKIRQRDPLAYVRTEAWKLTALSRGTHPLLGTPEQIVETVIQEDADAVGLSILSGAHMTLVPRIVELLREQDAGDVVVTVGGTIPADDIPELQELGVAAVFTPGAPTQDIIDFIQSAVDD